MTAPGDDLLGTMRAENGTAVIRMEDRYDTSAEDLWAAVTEPIRLARWIATVEGDLTVGGHFHATFTSGWEGQGRVEACEPPRRLLVTLEPGHPDQTQIEAWLTVEGADVTRLVVEERGIPLAEAGAHGAGWQAHLEDLAGYLAGNPGPGWRARWRELAPAYQAQEIQP